MRWWVQDDHLTLSDFKGFLNPGRVLEARSPKSVLLGVQGDPPNSPGEETLSPSSVCIPGSQPLPAFPKPAAQRLASVVTSLPSSVSCLPQPPSREALRQGMTSVSGSLASSLLHSPLCHLREHSQTLGTETWIFGNHSPAHCTGDKNLISISGL